MPDLTSVSLPAPKDWQAFERLARLLFEHSLRDPAVQNNGRPGQRQHGVDVYGHRGGGSGPLVGIQCKGKDADYNGAVTEAELKREVEKTKGFAPPLREFILITTAPADAKIQQAARLLEQQIRSAGRDLAVSVWGWDRVHQEIARFPEVLRAFHPDAFPYSQDILNEQKAVRALTETRFDAQDTMLGQIMAELKGLTVPTQIAGDTHAGRSLIDQHLNAQIDTYRDLIRNGRPKTSLSLLEKLKDQVWETASSRIRYRILANIGAAHYNLAQYDRAADFLLEAAPFDPDNPTSKANNIAALLIKRRSDEAHALAMDAIAQSPDDADVALQRIQALGSDETIETVWPSLTESVRDEPKLVIFRAMALREHQQPWWHLIQEAVARHPDDIRLKVIQAETVLERILAHDPSAIGLSAEDVPTQQEMVQAAETIEAAWEKSRSDETPPGVEFAHNAALLYNILGQYEKAAELLDAALKSGSTVEESKRLRLSLYRRAGNLDDAIRLADELPDSNISRIIRADLRTETAPDAVREILVDRDSFTDRTDIVAARVAVVESFVSQQRYDEALAEADLLSATLPDDPHGPLARYRAKAARGDGDAEQSLDEAVKRVTPGTSFPTRFLVCEALGKAERYDDIVILLSGVTATSYDSPALRMLVSASVNGDKRSSLKQLFDKLPAQVAEKPFYRRGRIGHALRIGNTRAAESEIRDYLELRPKSLEMHLQLMHALFRQNKIDALRKEAARPASDFTGSPEHFMHFAQFKDDFGDWKQAHDLAYRTLLSQHADPAVNMGYVGLFLRPGHSKELDTSPKTVGENMAVQLNSVEGKQTVYVIEPEERLRLTHEYLSPSQKMAQAILGAAVDQEITLPDQSKAKIAWIKPKVLHALHTILETFENLFPEVEGFESVRIETTNPDFEPVFKRVRQRHDAIESVTRLYDSGNLPLALVARSLGSDPVETMLGMIGSGHTIRVCEGNHQEREAAFGAINANEGKGCVIDPITLHIVRRLGLADAVAAVCGPIGITARTATRMQQKIYEIEERLDESDMSLSWRDGQIYRTEVTPDEKRAAYEIMKEDRAWLEQTTTVLPAEGSQDLGPEWKAITERFGRSFLDELRAAQSSGRLLVCDDYMLRMMGRIEFGVTTTWLQPVLMRALAKKVLTQRDYIRALVAFADSRMSFISLDGALLAQTLAGVNGTALPSDFVKLASLLGGAKADLPSHVNAALRCIRHAWNDRRLPDTLRQAVVGQLLENMIRERTKDHVAAILNRFDDFGRRVLRDDSFRQYLRDWMRGHFIVL